jgi:uncharacterized protein
MVSPYFTNYNDRYSIEERSLFYERMTSLINEYFWSKTGASNQKNEYLEMLIGQEYRELMLRDIMVSRRDTIIPYTRACIPGTKICVSYNGEYHICEKINEHFPIGDVDNGLALERIAVFALTATGYELIVVCAYYAYVLIVLLLCW